MLYAFLSVNAPWACGLAAKMAMQSCYRSLSMQAFARNCQVWLSSPRIGPYFHSYLLVLILRLSLAIRALCHISIFTCLAILLLWLSALPYFAAASLALPWLSCYQGCPPRPHIDSGLANASKNNTVSTNKSCVANFMVSANALKSILLKHW